MSLCEKCGRFIGHICFPPIPTCTCDDGLVTWPLDLGGLVDDKKVADEIDRRAALAEGEKP